MRLDLGNHGGQSKLANLLLLRVNHYSICEKKEWEERRGRLRWNYLFKISETCNVVSLSKAHD